MRRKPTWIVQVWIGYICYRVNIIAIPMVIMNSIFKVLVSQKSAIVCQNSYGNLLVGWPLPHLVCYVNGI